MKDEGANEGHQSLPVNWGISSECKRGCFRLLAEITGASGQQAENRRLKRQGRACWPQRAVAVVVRCKSSDDAESRPYRSPVG